MRAQDRDDFEAFVAARTPALLRTAFLLTGHPEAARDLLQDALVRTYSRWGRIREAPAREAYLRKVMVTTAATQRRRRWHDETPTDQPPDLTRTDPFAAADDRHMVLDALRGLSPSHRAVLILRYWEDLTEAQTAVVLGCSVGTVKSRASRALDQLRQNETITDETAKERR